MRGINGWFGVGALLAGVGVLLGAFGAHGLKGRVTPELLVIFETGVRYQLFHALGLLSVGWAATRAPSTWISVAGWAFALGIAIFSGSLYVMTVTGARWLGAITPIGGLAFLTGWACLTVGAWRKP
ncbi:MAG: DUF423 domain-containing protein [Acidobacteriota bacterium]|nr:DUF423 domain-containing protein [Acidobacteriota bacterium]MDH3785383.1 DUF423 domain-containing protein [Acidobacteriota bacterium]